MSNLQLIADEMYAVVTESRNSVITSTLDTLIIDWVPEEVEVIVDTEAFDPFSLTLLYNKEALGRVETSIDYEHMTLKSYFIPQCNEENINMAEETTTP